MTKFQETCQAMRRHWYDCAAKWPAPTYWGCSPGHTHPKCEEGMKLEKAFIDALRETQQ